MKIIGNCIVFFIIIWVQLFCFHDNSVYAADIKSCQIRVRGITQENWESSPIIRYSNKAKVADITADKDKIYLLDSKNSRIIIYDLSGKLISDINLKGVPACQFKNANRILVNYQGYIYVLDTGRNELMCFSNEGMFMGKVTVPASISMSIGEDQIIRVMYEMSGIYKVNMYDLNLIPQEGFCIEGFRAPRDNLIDLSVDSFGEAYVLSGDKAKISKIGIDGTLLNNHFGSKGSRLTAGSFMVPTRVLNTHQSGKTVLGILDSQQMAIQLFSDSDLPASGKLKQPLLTMRPNLSESSEAIFVGSQNCDSLTYKIDIATGGKGGKKKLGLQLSCVKNGGEIKYSVLLSSLKKQKVMSMDALAVSRTNIYICDSKGNAIHIFRREDGKYLSTFGEKGTSDGKLMKPSGIAVNSDGTVYVADTENMRITKWSSHGMYLDGINLRSEGLKPSILKLNYPLLYLMANGKSLYQIDLMDNNKCSLILNLAKMSSFELLYDGRIGIWDGSNQNLLIFNNNILEHKYFAFSPKGTFPFVANCSTLSYNTDQKVLRLCDAKTSRQYLLRFFYSPLTPQNIKISINKDKQAELSWDRGTGIKQWMVYELADQDTLYHRVSEPRYLIRNHQKAISVYQITSYSEDDKEGPLSSPIEDAYSYAMYLADNMNYAQAIVALKRAACTIRDSIIDQDIANNYLSEAQYYTRLQEYERALNCLKQAHESVGTRKDIIMARIHVYKLMKAYYDGIEYIRKDYLDADPDVKKQLISLYYLYNSIGPLINESENYLISHPKDVGIMKYLIYGYESNEYWDHALDLQRRIISEEDNFENHLKLAKLFLFAEMPDDTITQLNRMLTRYNDEREDEINFLYGSALTLKKQALLAAERYERAIRINPNIAVYHYGLAQSLFTERKLNDAEEHYGIAWNMNPQNIDYGFAYAKALEMNLKITNALSVLDAINSEVPADSSSIAFHEFYGDLLLRNNRYDDAYRELSLAVSYFPDNEALVAKYNLVIAAREEYYRFRDPIEVSAEIYNNVFPALQGYYRTNPIGSITVYNTRNVPIQNIQIVVRIPQLSDTAFQVKLPAVLANEKKIVDIILPVNRSIFTLCRNQELDMDTYLSIRYTHGLEGKVIETQNKIHALRINAMDWNNRRQYACFLNPADENVRLFVNGRIIQVFDNQNTTTVPKNIMRAMQIFNFYGANGVSYIPDPSSSNSGSVISDYVQFPFQTIAEKSGDCDDLVMLLASSLSAIGIECGFLDVQGHVILVMDSGVNADTILQFGLNLTDFIYRSNRYWLPIEATVLGKQSFNKSWMVAIDRYKEIMGSGIQPDLIEFSEAQQQYPPVNFSEPISTDGYHADAKVLQAFQGDLANVMLMSQISIEEEFIATIANYPQNTNVQNQYALWCVEIGKFDTAEALWLKILKQDPNHFSALVNLGNLYQKLQNYDASRANYIKALGQNTQADNLIRNLCFLEYRCGNLSKAREYFNRLQDKDVLSNINPKIRSELVGIGEQHD